MDISNADLRERSMNYFIGLIQIGNLFFLIVVGFFASKMNIVSEKAKDDFSSLLFNLVIPCAVLGIANQSFQSSESQVLWILILLQIATLTISMIVISMIAKRLSPKDKVKQAIYKSSLFFNNFSILGWPICMMLFGQRGFAYAFIYTLPRLLVCYIIIIFFIKKGLGNDEKTKVSELFKMMINPVALASFISLVLIVVKVKLPDCIMSPLEVISPLQVPMSMLLIGILLSKVDFKNLLSDRSVYIYAFIRLLIMPIVTMVALKAIGVSELIIKVCTMIAAMPAGAGVGIMAAKYNAEELLASKIIVNSTLISIFTIPLVMFLLSL